MSDSQPSNPAKSPEAALERLRSHLTAALSRELDTRTPSPEQYRPVATQLLQKIYANSNISLPAAVQETVMKQVLDDVVGFGPIQPFLEDPEVNEIMVNGAKIIFIEKHGELIETGATFQSDEHVLRVINRMIAPLGKRIAQDTPTVDAHLPGGSRLNAVIPPVALNGPCITIRKFLPNQMKMDDLIGLGSITPHMAEFLEACVAARLNILVTGPTSSGKTTFLNVLSNFIPEHERIITIEDAVELKLRQKHVISLETRPPDVDGSGAVTTRDLVCNVLRMRPDRIIIGEVRSSEALDMLQAMNTGHHGSMTTLHANSPRDATSRLETMVMMAGLELPLLAIRRQIAAAINLVVHQSRLTDGTRKTTQITEISGMEGDVITMTDIFKFQQTGIDKNGKIMGDLQPTGIRPLFGPRLEVVGFKLKADIFGAGTLRFGQ